MPGSHLFVQDKVGSRDGILAAILLCPIGSLGQGQMPLPSRALVSLVQGGLEGVLPAEPLFCFTCLLLMQRPGPAVLVQLTQRAGLQKKSATSGAQYWQPCYKSWHTRLSGSSKSLKQK